MMPKQIVEHFYRLMGQGRVDNILSLLSDDVTLDDPGDPAQIPTAGSHRGRLAVTAFFEQATALLDFHAFAPRAMVAEANKVVALGSETLAVRATGKSFSSDWASEFDIRDGRIAYFKIHLDTAAVAAAFAP